MARDSLVKKSKPETKNDVVKDVEKKVAMSKERREALDSVKLDVEKEFGKGTLMRMGDASFPDVEASSTGSLALDKALGVWGFPKGRIIEIYGPESSGKTTLALHAVSEIQKSGGVAAFIDAEHALDPAYAAKLGVDVPNLWISQPDNGEQALEVAERLVSRKAVDIIVIDSVAALTPQAEIDGDMGASHMGLQARLMSQALRKLTGFVHKSDVILIFINQIRNKIGVMFGNPETTTGGNALKFYASVRIDIRKTETLAKKDIPYANKVKMKVIKNKVAPPFRKAESMIVFGKGFNIQLELVILAVEAGIIKKSGSWYSMGDEKIGQGTEAVVKWLDENPDQFKSIYRQIRSS